MAINQYPSYDNIATTMTWKYTASAGQTELKGRDDFGQTLSYSPGIEQFYLNGVMLVRAVDYTATDGKTIIIPALYAGDYVQVICLAPYSAATTSTGNSESFHPFLLMGA
jgi:hypothetical protein